MIHLTMAQAALYAIGGLIALWILRKLVPVIWAVAKILPRIAFRLGIVALAGAELWLLLSHPPIFAAEFVVVAIAGYFWRRYEHQNGHSPLVAMKRLVLRRHEPTPLEELVEDVIVLDPSDQLMPAVPEKVFAVDEEPTRGTKQRRARHAHVDAQLKASLKTWEELWAPGEWEAIAKRELGDSKSEDQK